MKKRKPIGLIILVLVMMVIGVYSGYQKSRSKEVTLDGYLGGEKIGLFEDKDFKDYMKKHYHLTFSYHKDGSFDMVQRDAGDKDYLFPASQLALELFQKEGKSDKGSDIVFNTPIVLYSHKPVADALVKEGVAENRDGVYTVDMSRLAKMMAEGRTWESIGLPELYGTVLVQTTDPAKSNSGNAFLGLLANALNSNKKVEGGDVDSVYPELQKIYQRIGYMQTSSADMFSQYIRQGMGAYPIIAGYENQMLEFSKEQPDTYNALKDDLVIMYPTPTVWSSHVYIALSDKAAKGLDALKDPEIQKLAWEKHGFRTVSANVNARDSYPDVPGLIPEVTSVMQMPSYDVMEGLISLLQ